MPTKVKIHDEGYAELRLEGEPSVAEMHESIKEVLESNQILSTKFQRIYYLVDVEEVKEIKKADFDFTLKSFRNIDFDKAAFIGLDNKQQAVLDLITVLTGTDSKVRYFTAREEALEWFGE